LSAALNDTRASIESTRAMLTGSLLIDVAMRYE
jgi:hypothetical protein